LAPAIHSAIAAGRAGATGEATGVVVAVLGARGGVGTSTFAALLGAVWRERALVVDLDPGGAAQANFCKKEASRTLGDLAPLGGDVGPETLGSALVEQSSAARALLAAPGDPEPDPKHARALLRAARRIATSSIVDCGRGTGAGQRAAANDADVRALVLTLDVPAVRGARTLLEQVEGPVHVIVRRTSGAALRPRDASRALGVERLLPWPNDKRVARAVDLGRLRADRRARRLASALTKGLR
jgi:pilus assembly protein CpaE